MHDSVFHSLPMDIKVIARRLEALGNDTRLEVYRNLVRAGPAGLPVGALQARTGVAGSTLSHHLRKLISVDLIYQVREKTTLHCHANFATMNETLGFLSAECCIDAATSNARRSEPEMVTADPASA